jgi:hypothetical protein
MRLVKNLGTDRVLDALAAAPVGELDIASPELSLIAFAHLHGHLAPVIKTRWILQADAVANATLLGNDNDRDTRNRLRVRWLARLCRDWVQSRCEVRTSSLGLPQSVIVGRTASSPPSLALAGTCPFTTAGLGLTPSNQFGMIQRAETDDEMRVFGEWFGQLWAMSPTDAKAPLLARLTALIEFPAPEAVYHAALANVFASQVDELTEERIVKTRTGIKESVIWKKLFRFQRDGVLGAIDKLERYGGCIIADSVGLGKTFEALAVIKYYELRNDRVLVLCPKRLRDNWAIYKGNDRRNPLLTDRLNYDVLHHTDLSRVSGEVDGLDLAHINWGNYDLVVIDESHNFRNKKTPRAGGETRYDKLMKQIIQSGVKTRVLMLSATPVNNRLADLKNQIAFATEGKDDALADHGIANIGATVRVAQAQFNRWLKLDEAERTSAALMDMLGLDYFHLLDLLTIARSRKHVEKYYGTTETGKFPERLRPINIKADVDLAGAFRPIAEINDEIRRLKLSSYCPLSYVLAPKQAAYEAKYSQAVKGGSGVFKQSDREKSLIALLRVNVLKRMESAVPSFALTVERQLADVEAVLSRLESHSDADVIEELDIQDLEDDDSAPDSLFAGTKVKVLLQDVDKPRWRQDLLEDRNRLSALLAAARQVSAARDAKLDALKTLIRGKVTNPINPGNRKVIVFTAFADTAQYLYDALAEWAFVELDLHSACVTGSGRNRASLDGLGTDMASILLAFSPRSKERPADMAALGDLDLLIATDCISEGQNLQDCDYLVNYDIHWNPVRIIQRFGRIDRIGSANARIQLVNFWPNMQLEEYIGLEQRVSGRMVLLDVSATGEENVIEQQSGDPMNDLEYRRKQLLKLQDTVIDLEDLSTGVSIADLTLNDFRMELARLPQPAREALAVLPFGTHAVAASDGTIPAGAVFCLRAMSQQPDPNYPLHPHYLVQVADDGTVLHPHTQAKQSLDVLRKLCGGRTAPDAAACTRFDKLTRQGEKMEHYQSLLAAAFASVTGKQEERAAASLFTPGGTHTHKADTAADFEVLAWLAILPAEAVA